MTTDNKSGLMEKWLKAGLGLQLEETPFPWQERLLRMFVCGDVPSALDIPTGLGKTSVMAIWLAARAAGVPVPRRLVYVVDRRAVVDQATDVAMNLRELVDQDPELKQALGLTRSLPISTLRGQFVDNREWLEDPSLPAIIVGTVDMVGSRLLFSGYGVSPRMRPYHAGLLGVDALIVLDEAHLVPAFEDLLRQIADGADSFGPKDPTLRTFVPHLKLLTLSATGRHADTTSLTLDEEDRRHPIVTKRLTAKKILSIVELANEVEAPDLPNDSDSATAAEDDEPNKKSKGPQLAQVLARKAWDLTQQGSDKVRCLIFCDARKDATTVAAELRSLAKSTITFEPIIELFVGGRRVKERVQARETLAQFGFLAGTSVSLECSAFLIATSAGEVGVDLDADHMVCDLVAWERMVQRLGRVNRRGDGEAKVIIVVEREPSPLTTKAKEALAEKMAKRDAANSANMQLGELTKQLSRLQNEKTIGSKVQKRSSEEKAADQKRKQAEKELKKSISVCQKRIKAFKDADAKTVARHEAEVAHYRALQKLIATIGEGGSLSPDALLQIRQRPELADTLHAATVAEPLRPELTRALVDAWSMTSLDEHPGRPEVDPWLRGFRPNDPSQTKVVWRRYLPVRNDGSFDAKEGKRFFEAALPHTSEQLEIDTCLVLDWLIARALAPKPEPSTSVRSLLEKRASNAGKLSEKQQQSLSEYDAQVEAYEARPHDQDIVTVALTPRGEVKGWRTLKQLQVPRGGDGKREREHLEELLTGAMLVVDARLGGLTDGLLDPNSTEIVETADGILTTWLIRADTIDVPITGFRVRHLRTGEQNDTGTAWRTMPENGWVRRALFVTDMLNGEPSAVLVIDGWVGDAATEEERAEAGRPQQLDEHQSWAEEYAREISKRLRTEKKYEGLLALATRLHDEGKRAARWQRAFKAPLNGRPYAKTKGPIDFDILDGYRHELGSLPYVEQHDEFLNLDSDDRDFVLHLVGAHHGFARPVIGTSGCDDAPPSIVDGRAQAVAIRFARLSRRWGPWGLAWWEALLRAADQTASRRNQQVSAVQKERT